MKKRILIIDDDADVLAGLAALLTHLDWEVGTASTGKEAFRQFAAFGPDVVLLDVNLPDFSGLDILDHFKGYSEETPVIMMSGAGTIDVAVEAMKRQAETFVTKPYDVDNLEQILGQVLKNLSLKRELTALKRSNRSTESGLLGNSQEIRQLDALIGQIASAPSPVLLQGESGTGKGLIARMLHDRSSRARAPFVDLNCAGFSSELFQSELFGHEKGAFTDAGSVKPGLFEVASGGTVFLDEIGELQPAIQAQLLKALEEKRFRRVGGVRDIVVDIRLIAATNRDLEAEVREGRFRKDLFYRLNVVRIVVPPLRERIDDIPILIQSLLERLTVELKRPETHISDRAVKKLMSYSWPGNVRELRNVLERALLVTPEKEIRTEDLHLESTEGLNRIESQPPERATAIRPLDEVIADYVKQSVESTGGNIREAARQLQVSPSTIYAKLKPKP